MKENKIKKKKKVSRQGKKEKHYKTHNKAK